MHEHPEQKRYVDDSPFSKDEQYRRLDGHFVSVDDTLALYKEKKWRKLSLLYYAHIAVVLQASLQSTARHVVIRSMAPRFRRLHRCKRSHLECMLFVWPRATIPFMMNQTRSGVTARSPSVYGAGSCA